MTPRKPRYQFIASQAVLDRARELLNDTEHAQFERCLEMIRHGPRVGESMVDVSESKIGPPGSYIAPFDDALLLYQVKADYPLIRLLDIVKP